MITVMLAQSCKLSSRGAVLAKLRGLRMPMGATGSRGMTHHCLIRVAWQGQRMKEG